MWYFRVYFGKEKKNLLVEKLGKFKGFSEQLSIKFKCFLSFDEGI